MTKAHSVTTGEEVKAVIFDSETHQEIANAVALDIYRVLARALRLAGESLSEDDEDHINAAPFVQGAICGAILVLCASDCPDEKIKMLLDDAMNTVPQLRLMVGGMKGEA